MSESGVKLPAAGAKLIRDAHWIDAQLSGFAREIAAQGNLDLVVVAGIRRRGAELARRVADRVNSSTSTKVHCGALDVTLYRDDAVLKGPGLRTQNEGTILAEVDNRIVYLIDDVMYTGRTIRAAIAVLMDYGRPGSIRLFSLVDRGGRELPIQPDRVGERLIVPAADRIDVRLKETDGEDGVFVTVGGMR